MKLKEDNGPYNIYAETEFTVEFFHLDPLYVVWHGNYINYFEIGRRVLLEKIGYSYKDMKETNYTFPVIEVSAKYIGSLRFLDRAIIKAILLEYENRLKIRYVIRNAKTGVIVTKGSSTQMAIDLKTGESCFYCPKLLIDRVEALIGNEKP